MGLGYTGSLETAPQKITGLSNIKKIAAGPNYALALATDGSLYAWGYNGYGALGLGSTKESVVNEPREVMYFKEKNTKLTDINAGGYYGTVLAITEHKDVYAWGYNYYGQVKSNYGSTVTEPIYKIGRAHV